MSCICIYVSLPLRVTRQRKSELLVERENFLNVALNIQATLKLAGAVGTREEE